MIAIKKTNKSIEIVYESTGEIKEYFSDIPFFCEYSVDIADTPDEIAIIPFIVNVLPMIWLFDADLYVPEIDKAFYECIDKVKEGYVNMYPEAEFLGRIHADKIIRHDYVSSNRSAVLFSGGLDATHTLLRHLDKNPDIVTIWGADLSMNDIEGWERVKKATEVVANRYNLKDVYIKSSFASFIHERALSKRYWSVLHSFWYHNAQHGIGMLGLLAPYTYKNHMDTVYIASSYSSNMTNIECASDPTIDNQLKMSSCSVVHDAFEFSRQDKIKDIVHHCEENNDSVFLRVCWYEKLGENCCRCEKCLRTITGLLVESADPRSYGFPIGNETLQRLKKFMTIEYQCDSVTIKIWKDIQIRFRQNIRSLRQLDAYKYLSWIKTFDFADMKGNKYYRAKQRIARLRQNICKILPRNVKDLLKKFIHIS